ncbi:MAG: universal stress protein [Xanthomonadales bacterium]|nr:universal stress protein [Xanthomonadales bacterium]
MLPNNPDTTTQQVAVILNTSGSGRPLLNILQQLLGEDTETQLHGVFIEDDELQRVAALPFVKELSRLTLNVREIHSTRFDRIIALRVRTARSAVEGLARRMGVSHTFRKARGSTVSLLRETVHTSNITVFEPSRKLAASTISQPLQVRSSPRHIVVVIDDTDTCDKALLTATLLAKGRTHRITVILRVKTPVEEDAMNRLINDLLPTGPDHLLLLQDKGIQNLVAAVRAERADMLVLGASEELLKPETLRVLLKHLECPVCLVRQLQNHVNESAG